MYGPLEKPSPQGHRRPRPARDRASSRRSSCSSSVTASCRDRCSTASPPRPTPSSRATRRRCRRRRPRRCRPLGLACHEPGARHPGLRPGLPEIILAAGALVLVLVGAYRGERLDPARQPPGAGSPRRRARRRAGAAGRARHDLQRLLRRRPFAKFMKVLTLLGSGAAIVMSSDYLRREGIDRFEFGILIVLSTVGMLVMISANDLIALYLGLELQSLAAYVIASFHRDNLRSTEAGLKYFVLGALSSGHAALRRLAGLRLHRHGRPSRASRRRSTARRRASASSSASSSSPPASPSRSRRCRSTCGRPTSTRARRRR